MNEVSTYVKKKDNQKYEKLSAQHNDEVTANNVKFISVKWVSFNENGQQKNNTKISSTN